MSPGLLGGLPSVALCGGPSPSQYAVLWLLPEEQRATGPKGGFGYTLGITRGALCLNNLPLRLL